MRGAVLPLTGPGGEPVDLWRTFLSHGVASLPPLRIDAETRTLTATLPVGDTSRTVRIAEGAPGFAAVSAVDGRPLDSPTLAAVRHVLRLDEDLSGFYRQIAGDPDLAWATRGAGRLIRSATVFEEVVKTVCTTNCAWSATVRMVGALVEHLGVPGPAGRAFPTPVAMAEAGEAFYRDTARAGYRGAYLLSLARSVAEGTIDLEVLGRPAPDGPNDDDVATRLLALPGVGPYAVAHVMLLLGRYSRLVLDSWTRPKYARLAGLRGPNAVAGLRGPNVPDADIVERFAPYGPYAGLAFWLYLTADWVEP
ncbi:MAG: Fe-S cluster assembly protein HesB [Actinomycetota bacterium]|nr:Fe-S cluster assembly protein HesB [Actinomycetota bacterium]